MSADFPLQLILMENYYLAALVEELKPQLQGKTLRRVAMGSLSRAELLLDFHLPEGKWLVASFEPSRTALYLSREGREQINEAHGFAAQVARDLSGRRLIRLDKPPSERIIQL